MDHIPEPQFDSVNDEETGFTLREIGALIWRRKLRVLGTMIVALMLGALYLKTQQPLYTATMLAMPAERQSTGASSGALGMQLLAGLGGAPQEETFVRYLNTFGTVSFAERLQSRYALLQRVFVHRWDPQRRQWLPPSGMAASVRGAISEFFGLPAYVAPSPAALASYLGSKISDEQVGTTTIYRITFTHPDPRFAAELLTIVHREADALLRDEEAAATRLKIASLQRRIALTTESEHRTILYNLLGEQQRRLMLIDPRLPFAAVVVDSPASSELPTSPRPVLTLIIALFLGAVVGIALAVLPGKRGDLRSEAEGG